MSDLISRQAAIDTIERAVTKDAARWLIKELPSAQPEIIRCKDCKHRHKITCAFLIANCIKSGDDEDFCSRGERKDDE